MGWYLLAIEKVEQVHQDQEWQQVRVYLAQKGASHLLMPFWALGSICLIEDILVRVQGLPGVVLELDLFCTGFIHSFGMEMGR